MWTRSTEDEHGLSARHRHVESPDVRLAVFKRNVSTVYAARQRTARCFQSTLCGGVVAVAELELDDIAHSSDHGIRIESVLGSADYHRNELVLSRNCSRQYM
jgi:hypothetical protein